MMTLILSMLIVLGLIESPADFDKLSTEQQNNLVEIVITDSLMI